MDTDQIQKSEALFPIRDNSCNPCQNFFVPEEPAKLKEANAKEIKFDEVVEKVKQAAVRVLAY
jgi:hypothetical protein